METQLIRCLKVLVTELFSDETNVETIVDKFLANAELALSPAGREELIQHISYTSFVVATEIPE